jgi:alpha-galactosidase
MTLTAPLASLGMITCLTLALGATGPAAASPAVVPASHTDPTLSPTPYMGWNTYYGLGGDFDEDEVKEVADALVDRGLAEAGYDIVWLDGGWTAETPRDDDGNLVADPDRFPSGMKALTDYIHGKGLRAGIYTEAGPYIPGTCGLGSHGYYQEDADLFAEWEFDAVKVDFLCGIAGGLDPKSAFTEFAEALRNNSSDRPMIFNLCNPVTSPDWGDYPEELQSIYSWSYAPDIAQSWRTYTDVGFVGFIRFPDVLRNFDANAAHPEVAGPGHWNDPDYLGPELGMTTEEFRTQMSLWSVAAAPLIIASDVRSLSQESIDILTDPDVLAINQDPAGIQATRVGPAGTTEIWVKPLAHGARAVLLLNRGDAARTIATTTSDVGLNGDRFSLANAWTDELTETRGGIRASVPARAATLLRVEPTTGRPGIPHVTVGEPRLTEVGGAAVGDTDDIPVAAPGDVMRVEVDVTNDGLGVLRKIDAVLGTPDGWSVAPTGQHPRQIRVGQTVTYAFDVVVNTAEEPGQVELSANVSYTAHGGPRDLESQAAFVVAPAAPETSTPLSHHPWISATSGWMEPTIDLSVGGGSPISMLGQVYETGIGVASPSAIRYYLGRQCTRLTADVGLDDAVRNVGPEGATAGFTIIGDGGTLFDSGTLSRDDVVSVDVDLTGVRVLELLVNDGGDGGYNDRANWAGLNATCGAA